ncbi:NEDD8-specific protease [Aureococcus anophagefferens]|nr:NEDD8-specific protease [Aureococcus anophagefferens]
MAAGNDDEELRKAIAASLAEQPAADENADIQRAIEASTTPQDLNALTAAEQDKLTIEQMNAINDEIQSNQAMVGDRVGVAAALAGEYDGNANAGFGGIAELDGKYASLRRVRKDGNCFYRGFLYRYLEHLCELQAGRGAGAPHPELERVRAVVRASKAKILSVDYEETAIDMFWEMLVEVLDDVPKTTLAQWHAKMNEEHGVAMHIVWFCRVLSAAQIKLNADRFAPFVMDETGAADVADFCRREVEPVNHECEQVQIIAHGMLEIPVPSSTSTEQHAAKLVFPRAPL